MIASNYSGFETLGKNVLENGRRALSAFRTFFSTANMETMPSEEMFTHRRKGWEGLFTGLTNDLKNARERLALAKSDQSAAVEDVNRLQADVDSIHTLWKEVDREYDLFLKTITPQHKGDLLPLEHLSVRLDYTC